MRPKNADEWRQRAQAIVAANRSYWPSPIMRQAERAAEVVTTRHSMTALTDILAKASAGAYGDDSELIGRVVGWAAAVKFDKGFGPFICGTLGKEGADGLHEGYLICPAYGADFNMTAGFMRDPKR